MRQPLSMLRYLVLLLSLVFAARAYADDRTEARAHYQAGVKFYAGADYQNAIREFSAAQQLAPADLNNYNLALCYDKLGDAEPAIQYYRAFLDKQPGTDKRAEIEASISRLDAALRSAASKKADDARRADPPKSAPVPGPDAALPPGPLGPPVPSAAVEPRKPGPAIAGSLDAPSAAPPPTGDSQLDRVNSIDVDRIRDQRMGGIPENRGGPAVAAQGAGSQPGELGPTPGGPGNPPPPASVPDQPKATPVYKKWWFWAMMVPVAIVVYELATTESTASAPSGGRGVASAQPRGLTLLSW